MNTVTGSRLCACYFECIAAQGALVDLAQPNLSAQTASQQASARSTTKRGALAGLDVCQATEAEAAARRNDTNVRRGRESWHVNLSNRRSLPMPGSQNLRWRPTLGSDGFSRS
ncbi:hypothetical protein BCAR13_1140030 [Paraburkholderia caribensis]|nr:hypothetical protein BCAR13_1140030 [Paraburkholderia caribensis]